MVRRISMARPGGELIEKIRRIIARIAAVKLPFVKPIAVTHLIVTHAYIL
jgi:hypothetical protein